jgi:hypothetical protein
MKGFWVPEKPPDPPPEEPKENKGSTLQKALGRLGGKIKKSQKKGGARVSKDALILKRVREDGPGGAAPDNGIQVGH